MVPRNSRLFLFIPLLASFFLACGGSSPDASLTLRDEALTRAGVPAFGAAASFAVLASTAVTCTNGNVVGNVGVSPGLVITQTSCPVTGTVDAGGPAATQAHDNFLTAYDAFKALACDRVLTTLDAQTLPPGVYCFDAAATSTGGVLTLNGPPTGIWVFKVGTLGTGALTGTSFLVVTPNGTPPPCNNVYWWVAGAATLTDSKFVGSVLAGAAITLTRGTFNGDAFAKTAVTITGDAVTACPLVPTPRPPPPPVCKGKTCGCEDKDKKGGNHGKKHGTNGNDDKCGNDDDGDDDGRDHQGGERHGRHGDRE
jgi:hypothetical protein